jgi:carbamoyl-phosphate synthase large subunit
LPKRQDLKKIVILGSGPIVIGQACEFDYSGTQACKALVAQGYEVILINSNPATIMTDPDMGAKVYIEPLKKDFVEKILEIEKPQALIPTLGGQTALNLGLELNDSGILSRLNIQLLGANAKVIRAAEDREQFKKIVDNIGGQVPASRMVTSMEGGLDFAAEIGYPVILRPNFTLGGGGSGTAFSKEELNQKLAIALNESPTREVLVEESIYGWKEFELEIMRDEAGTFVVICSIENVDPCGVHTGDSITVAPQQTLSDVAYQAMRDEARKIVEAVGVETGGANIQFAVDPVTSRRVVIEMNPRVSRSSALASKATGFPIAKIAALVAVGYHLDEIVNDITKTTPSCYEPALDYVVTKIPRFNFEKFNGSKDSLGTQMKSVGEVMAIGRTFNESFMKALVSLEASEVGIPKVGLAADLLSNPNSQRIYQVFQALRNGLSVEEINHSTQIDPWFIEQFQTIIKAEATLQGKNLKSLTANELRDYKRMGFSDAAIAQAINATKREVWDARHRLDVLPGYNQVDTCAGEFASSTPYFYSSYWAKRKPIKFSSKTVAVIGSGSNRIGQGIEFDYSCVRGVKALKKLDHQVLMINSNPETVSTDYDTSDYLFFEPLQAEHVAEAFDFVSPIGFIAQLGGQTPINMAKELINFGHKMLGSTLKSIDLAEDRGQFTKICKEFGFLIPESKMVSQLDEAIQFANEIGYPLICRPSYVLGGRRMEIIESEPELVSYFLRHGEFITKQSPAMIDQFLERALEVDVDLIRGTNWTIIGGIVEHIEAAGVHSGDSMGVIPPQRLKLDITDRIEIISAKLAEKLDVKGFLNLQLAVKNDQIYMIEANPRSSRSVPFIAKATEVPIVDLGVAAILGLQPDAILKKKTAWRDSKLVHVKGVVFPFKKFPETDIALGPEMKSTGETMGRGRTYSEALIKAIVSSHITLPKEGEVFLSLRDKDKPELLPELLNLKKQGYTFSATGGTAQFLTDHGFTCETVKKVHQGRPNCVDRIRSGQVALVINTTSGKQSLEASHGIRRSCLEFSIPCLTESEATKAFVIALEQNQTSKFSFINL